MPGHKDLVVWSKAMELVEECYRVTVQFPRSEAFGLCSQIRRAAVSIPSNIAEGHNRRTRAAYAHHVSIALGSQAELETQLELAGRLGLAATDRLDAVQALVGEVGRALHGLARALEHPPSP